MGDGERDMGYAQGCGNLCRSAMETNRWAPTGLSDYFNFKPAYAAADPGAQSLGPGFFCREAGGKALCRIAFAETVSLLGGGVYAVEEPLSKSLNRLLDPGDFYQVDATSDDHAVYQANIHGGLRGGGWSRRQDPNGPAFAHLDALLRDADRFCVRPGSIPRDTSHSDRIPWALQMRAISNEEPSRLVKMITGAILGCNGWVLSRGASDTGLIDILFEFERQSCLEIYSVLMATGLELSRAAHLQFTELCQCTRMGRQGCGEEIVSVDLEIQTFALTEKTGSASVSQ